MFCRRRYYNCLLTLLGWWIWSHFAVIVLIVLPSSWGAAPFRHLKTNLTKYNYVAWAQCSRKVCGKWRRLKDSVDPVTLAKDWTCSQNPDALYNSCDLPEEAWDGKDNDIIYAELVPGSIVWAKQSGYPWWPAMVEHDPRSGKYFMFTSDSDQFPSKYHVTFFDKNVTHAWIAVSLIKNFQENPRDKGISKRDFAKRINAGKKMAEAAQKVKIQDRLPLFGFAVRYKGNRDAELSEDYSSQESLEIYWNVKERQRSTSKEVEEDRNEDSAIKVPIVAETQQEAARKEKDVDQIDGEPKKRRKPQSPVRKELLARPKRFRDPTLKTDSARKADRGETANSSGVKKPARGLPQAKPKADKASAFGPGRGGPCRKPDHRTTEASAATDQNEEEQSTEQDDPIEDSFFITQKNVDCPELFREAAEKKQEVDLLSDDDMDILMSKKVEQDEEFAEFMFEE